MSLPSPALPPEPAAAPDAGLAALSRALDASFRFLRRGMAAVALLYLASGVFTLRQDEVGFVLVGGQVRGGDGDRLLRPGLHWTWPRPFARVVRVPAAAREVRTDAFWHEEPAGQKGLTSDQLPPPPPTLHPRRDGYLLSADTSLFHARLAARYRVADPAGVRFGFAEPERLLENELRRAALRAAAQTPVDEALRTEGEAFRKRIEDVLRDRCAKLRLGLEIDRVDLMTAPPRQAAAAFQDVVKARLESSRAVEQARARANRLANEAAGEADGILARATAEKTRLVADTTATVARFRAVLARYRDNPVIVGNLLLQESLSRALAGVGETFVLPGAAKGDELRLNIPRLPRLRGKETP